MRRQVVFQVFFSFLWAILAFHATPALAVTPTTGDLVFSEIAPEGGYVYYCEWFEMVNRSGDDLDLSTCQLCIGPSESSLSTEFSCKTIESSDDDFTLAATHDSSMPALFARNTNSCKTGGDDSSVDCVAWNEDGSECTAHADMLYSGEITGDSERICLLCGESDAPGTCLEPGEGQVLVDEVTIAWDEDLDNGCDQALYPGKCAVQACVYEAAHNDDVTRESGVWSFPVEGGDGSGTYWVPDEYGLVYPDDADTGDLTVNFYKGLGTPGAQNDCSEVYASLEGELVFTEVMADPDGSAEWIELSSLAADTSLYDGTGDRHLNNCTLELYKLSDEPDSGGDAWSLSSSWFVVSTQLVTISPGQALVMAIDDCLYDQGDTGYEPAPGTLCSSGELDVGLGSLSNSTDLRLELHCLVDDSGGGMGDVLVDAFDFNAETQDSQDGVALMLDPASNAASYAEANDSRDAWCTASYTQQPITDLSDDERSNWGTPGIFGAGESDCLTGAEEPGNRIPCRCGSAQAPFSWWSAAVLGLLMVARRRRPGTEEP